MPKRQNLTGTFIREIFITKSHLKSTKPAQKKFMMCQNIINLCLADIYSNYVFLPVCYDIPEMCSSIIAPSAILPSTTANQATPPQSCQQRRIRLATAWRKLNRTVYRRSHMFSFVRSTLYSLNLRCRRKSRWNPLQCHLWRTWWATTDISVQQMGTRARALKRTNVLSTFNSCETFLLRSGMLWPSPKQRYLCFHKVAERCHNSVLRTCVSAVRTMTEFEDILNVFGTSDPKNWVKPRGLCID